MFNGAKQIPRYKLGITRNFETDREPSSSPTETRTSSGPWVKWIDVERTFKSLLNTSEEPLYINKHTMHAVDYLSNHCEINPFTVVKILFVTDTGVYFNILLNPVETSDVAESTYYYMTSASFNLACKELQ